MNKKILATVSLAGIIGMSGFAYAQNNVFRYPIYGVKSFSNVGSEEGSGSESGEETQESNLIAPTDVIFSEGGDQVSANVGDSGTITIYDESGSQIGQTTSDDNGDFTSSLSPVVVSGDVLDVTITDGTDTITAKITVPEGVGDLDPNIAMCASEELLTGNPYTQILSDMGNVYHRVGSPYNEYIIHNIKYPESRPYLREADNPNIYWQDVRDLRPKQPLSLFDGIGGGSQTGSAFLNNDYTQYNGKQELYEEGVEFYMWETEPSRVQRGELIEIVDNIPHYSANFVFGPHYEGAIVTLSDIEKTENYQWCVDNGYETAN